MPPAPAPDRPGRAVVLAGGSGRRLGTLDKPGLRRGDRSLLEIALAAAGAVVTVVVGPHRVLPPGVLTTREDPPGGGPAAALVAGLLRLAQAPPPPVADDLIIVLAADLPNIDPTSISALAALVRAEDISGAVLQDPGGRRQYLAGVWRFGPLTAAIGRRPTWHNARLADLLDPLIGAVVAVGAAAAADVDTPADLQTWDVRSPGPA